MDILFDIKIGQNKINCKTFTLEDYVKFLIAKGSDDSNLIKHWMVDILSSHTTYDGLVKHESEMIIINLMAKSLNENDVTKDFVCECGHEFGVKVDPSKIYVNYNDTQIEDLYDLGNFKISLRYPNLFDDDNISLMIVKALENVYVGDDCIPIDELSDAEIDDLQMAITSEDMDKIKNILLSPKLQLDAPIVCPKCGKSHVHSIKGFHEFIRIFS